MVLTPGFIGTVVFFHQVHVSEVKGWSLAAMAPAYPVYAVVTVVTAITTGWAIDRIGPLAFLPLVLLPMARPRRSGAGARRLASLGLPKG